MDDNVGLDVAGTGTLRPVTIKSLDKLKPWESVSVLLNVNRPEERAEWAVSNAASIRPLDILEDCAVVEDDEGVVLYCRNWKIKSSRSSDVHAE